MDSADKINDDVFAIIMKKASRGEDMELCDPEELLPYVLTILDQDELFVNFIQALICGNCVKTLAMAVAAYQERFFDMCKVFENAIGLEHYDEYDV